MAHFRVYLTGDTKAVYSMAKQITFAGKQMVVELLRESQPAVIADIRSTFTVRRAWYEPGNRYGIHIRFSKDKNDLSGRLETAADWLDEHETGEDRTPETEGHHGPDPHLTYPHAARPNRSDIVATDVKAWRILPNVSELLTRRGFRTSGRATKRNPKFNEVQFFINRARTAVFERLPDRRLKLFYTLTKRARIRRQSTVIEPTVQVVRTRAGAIFSDKIVQAIRTAK